MRISPISFNNAYSRNNNIKNNIKNNKVNAAQNQRQNNKNISFGFFDSEIVEKQVRQILTAGPTEQYKQCQYDESFRRLKDTGYVRIYAGPDKTLYVEYEEACLVDPFARNYCKHYMLSKDPYEFESIATDSERMEEVLTKPIKVPEPVYDDYPEILAQMRLDALAQ